MYLALDLGSSNVKAAIFDVSLRRLGAASGPTPTVRSESASRCEIDVHGFLDVVRATMCDALGRAGVAADAVTCIAITSQAQTFTVLDAGGAPKTPFVSWQDGRAGQEMVDRALSELPDFAEHCSFAAPLLGLQLFTLRHLQRHGPGIGIGDVVLNLPSYLVQELCGEAWVDDNLAAMSGLYSLRDRTWWPDALAYAGVSTEQLPRLCSVGSAPAVTGAGAGVYGLPAGIPVVTAGNDQTAGAVGAEIDQYGSVLITLGTAMAVYACSEGKPIAHVSLVRGPYPGGGTYRMATAPGGSCVSWAASRIESCSDEEAFFRLAANGSDEVVFTVTGPAGEGDWEPPDADGPSKARAVIRALARRMRGMLSVVDPSQELSVFVAGGGTRSVLWLTLLEQALGRHLSVVEADPLRGAARMAARLQR